MTIPAAALQFCPALLDPESNLARVESFLRACDAALAVLPELCTTGYFFESRAQLDAYAEDAAGRTAQLLRSIARERRMAIVAGFAERDGAGLYNAALIALPDGSSSVYRKTHLFGEEKLMFDPGDTGFGTVRMDGAVLGTMICYDWRFPESVRTLALRGAQVICHPSDLVALPRLWKPVMRTRSFENKVYTITANRTGAETRGETTLVFHGCSQITDVNGAVLAETDEQFEGWIRAELDPSRTVDKRFSPWNDIFADRRPDMYER